MFSQFSDLLSSLQEQQKDTISRVQEQSFQFSQFIDRMAAIEKQHKDLVSKLTEQNDRISLLESENAKLKEKNLLARSGGMTMIGYDSSGQPVFVSRNIEYENFMFKLRNNLQNGTFIIDSLADLHNITRFEFKDLVYGGPVRYEDSIVGHVCSTASNGCPYDYSDAARDAFKRVNVKVLYAGKPL
jgi:hypothetical protein